MLHRRCLLQFVMVGLFIESSVYLWKKHIGVNHKLLPSEGGNQSYSYLTTDKNSGVEVQNESNASIGKNRIQPFSEFHLDDENIIKDLDMFKIYDWWDLWNGDQKCSHFQVHLLKPGSQPHPGAFVSFPGSGNTWIRSLIMGITGVYLTSAYTKENRHYHTNTFEVPTDCKCSLLQKTHDFALDGSLARKPKDNLTDVINDFRGKGILIIRNPFKAIQSYRNFQYGGMKGTAPLKAFSGESWDSFVSRSIASWETLATVWIRGLKQGGIVYYERMRRETSAELKRLMLLLGFSYDKNRFECVLRHSQHNPMRRKIQNKLMNPYSGSQRLLIHKAIDNIQHILYQQGLEPLPVEHYDLYDIIPEYGREDPSN